MKLLTHGWARLLAAVAAGGLVALTTELRPHWWGVWLAPIPLLAAALQARAGEARRLALLTGLLGGVPLIGYFNLVLGPVWATLCLLLLGVAWMFTVMMTRRVLLNATEGAVVFFFPALWAALDTVVTAFSPHAMAASFAPDEVGFRAVLQAGAVAGNAGIVFLILLPASCVVVAAWHGRRLRHAAACYGLAAALIAAVLGWGAVRADRLPTGTGASTLRAGMVVINDADPDTRTGVAASAAWAQYLDALPGEAAAGAQLVIFPEKTAPLLPADRAAVAARLAAGARDYNVYLLAGVDLHYPDHFENRAWLFAPDGTLLADYAKQHPVPGLEAAYRPGHTDVTPTVAGVPTGLVICKDLDFPALDRAYARRRISVMLQPAWDFDIDEQWRADMANLAGVENGYSVIHVAKNGLLQVSDRYGHVTMALASERAPVASAVAGVALAPPAPTFYALYGDWFGWLCVAALLAMALRRLTGNRLSLSGAAAHTSTAGRRGAAAMR